MLSCDLRADGEHAASSFPKTVVQLTATPTRFQKTKVVADIFRRQKWSLTSRYAFTDCWVLYTESMCGGEWDCVQIQMPILFFHKNIASKRLETIISLFRARSSRSHAPRQFGRSPSVLNLGFEGGSEVEQLQLVVGTPRACPSCKNLFQV